MNGVNRACGDDSDCINRLTSIECSNEKCQCGEDCQNQRFQKKQYADVDIIHTEKKGYGMRANVNIPHGTFVYEYIGEVVPEAKFRKRAKYYEKSGLKHFYFMMLQQGEFIDATAKGCLARFCNHSCNPNCYVDKWVVGDKLKMGIFTKRDIQAGEEITFDYNVDRYGSEAQPCYCGESNCVGVLGGKTQTEVVSRLPQLLVEALELDAADEYQWMAATKKTRKKKAANEKLDEDYGQSLPTKPITIASVSKVMSSLMQNKEEWLVSKLVARISSTTDNAIHARVMQMHGYQVFSQLLRDWKSNQAICVEILKILNQWPRVTKNKISSSKIESTVQELSTDSEFEDVKELSKSLLAEWSNLQMAYRIPRRERVKTEEATGATPTPSENSAPESKATTPTEPNNNSKAKKDKRTNGRNSNSHDSPFASSHDDGKGYNHHNNKNSSKQHRYSLEGVPTGPANNKRKSFGNGANSLPVSGPNSTTLGNGSHTVEAPLPAGWELAQAPNNGRTYYFNRKLNITQWDRPTGSTVDNKNPEQAQSALGRLPDDVAKAASAAAAAVGLNPANQALTLQKIIEEASRKQEMQRKLAQEQENEREEKRLKREQRKREERASKGTSRRHEDKLQSRSSNGTSGSKSKSGGSNSEEKTKRALTLVFAKYVPKVVVLYEPKVGHEEVKRHSKDITNILVQKEMRANKNAKAIDELSSELKSKIRAFVKMYMDKVVAHKEMKAHRHSSTDPTELKQSASGPKESEKSLSSSSSSHKRQLDDDGSEQVVSKKANTEAKPLAQSVDAPRNASPDGEINFDD